MTRFARIAAVSGVAIAAIAITAQAAIANAATGDMNEVLSSNDTHTDVLIFEDYVNDQVRSHAGSLSFDNTQGAVDPANLPGVAPSRIVVSLNQAEGLRTQSQLAPLVEVTLDTIKFLGGESGQDISSVEAQTGAARFVGQTVGGFVKKYGVNVTDQDVAALHQAVVNGTAVAQADVSAVTASFDQAYQAANVS